MAVLSEACCFAGGVQLGAGQEEPVCCESAEQLRLQALSWLLLLRGIYQHYQWFGQSASGLAGKPCLKVFLVAVG